jgi:hypothetical protein
MDSGRAFRAILLVSLSALNAAWGLHALAATASTFEVGRGFSASIERTFYHSRHAALDQLNGSEVTAFALHRKTATGMLHYGNTFASAERHQHFGLSTERLTAAYFEGSGVSFPKAGQALYEDLNHYFFHGGSRAPFKFQGGGLGLDVARGVSARIAGVRLRSPGLEDRYGHYAGITAGRLSGGIFGLKRGRRSAGHGFNLSFGGVRGGFGFQEVRSDAGGHLRRAGFSWRSAAGARFSLDLEDARNPLYAAGDERRIMFRFQRSFGRRVSFSAAEQPVEADDDDSKQGKYVKVVGIGLGVGALAAAASSGDGDGDAAARFATADAAAFDVLNRINPVSVRENREHGGWIYRKPDGSFNSTAPVAGSVASVNIGNPASTVPRGTAASASYHTHGGPDPRYDNENFSPQDVLSDTLVGLDGYLGTPSGLLKKHVVSTNQIVVLGRIAN